MTDRFSWRGKVRIPGVAPRVFLSPANQRKLLEWASMDVPYKPSVRVTAETQSLLARIAARRGMTIKAVLEMLLADLPDLRRSRKLLARSGARFTGRTQNSAGNALNSAQRKRGGL
jgi:hypothetical protein